ncbi:MAG: AAA family ATPase, partial [Bacillota bacterium]|nr:AAA family ATPase [Bacillota bacterium]
KSLLIKKIIEDDSKVILISRPRRFGKTINMSMIGNFFNNINNDGHLFNGLLIEQYKNIMEKQGKHPVIFISFKDQKYLDWENCKLGFNRIIRNEFSKYYYLVESELLKEHEKKEFYNILNETANDVSYIEGIKKLSEYLYRYHNEKVVIILDEYDIPVQEAFFNNYYNQAISYLRNLLSGDLKDNPYLEKGILTGILRVAKESIFSGLNNIKVYSLLNSKYGEFFGFTEHEVEEILKYYNIKTELENIKLWYNGYNFGGKVIYNPWSILNYIKDIDRGLICHWINTSSNELIRDIIAKSDYKVKVECESLIKGEGIEKKINENIVMEDIAASSENVWTFLLFTGYLKVEEIKSTDGDIVAKLAIPNNEVRTLFKDIIIGWFSNVNVNEDLGDMLSSLVNGDIETFDVMFSKTIEKTLSYFDLSGESEKFYHAFVLGMLVALEETHYIRSNRESGYGRYDVMVIPKDKSQLGLIIEFKNINKRRKETLEQAAEKALNQIKDKKYNTEMKELGIEKILELAIAFDGKEVLIKEFCDRTKYIYQF